MGGLRSEGSRSGANSLGQPQRVKGLNDLMFEALSSKLNGVFDRPPPRRAVGCRRRRGAARFASRWANIALPVVRDLVNKVRERGSPGGHQHRLPAQQVIKIVNDALVEALGGGEGDDGKRGIDLNAPSPVPILMVGLQGSARPPPRQDRAACARVTRRRSCLPADVHRPAAQLQLQTLAQQLVTRRSLP